IRLLVDSSLAPATFPAGFTLDPRFVSAEGVAPAFPGFGADLLTLDDTAQWSVGVVSVLSVVCDSRTMSSWVFQPSNTGPIVLIDDTAQVALAGTAVVAAYKAPNGIFGQFTVRGNSSMLGTASVPFLSVASGGFIELF